MNIWDIIDNRWGNKMHPCLHVATYNLNPRFKYDDLLKDKRLKAG